MLSNICLLNLPTTTKEVGIPGVMLEMCGVRCELCVLQEVLFEETRLGPGAGVLRDSPGVCALLELLKPEVECICLAGFYHLFVSLALNNWTVM